MTLNTNVTVSEVMQSYCVMVNGGSGVLVSAMTKDYSYVLTARHVVVEEADRNTVTDQNGIAIEALDVLIFPKIGEEEPLDCAILKVTHQPWLSQRSCVASHLPHEANLTLVGLPGTERDSSTPIKHWNGHSARDTLKKTS